MPNLFRLDIICGYASNLFLYSPETFLSLGAVSARGLDMCSAKADMQ